MKTIIKKECVQRTSTLSVKKFLCTAKAGFLKFWEKYKLAVGYAVAGLSVIIFLTGWSFNILFFILSLIWALCFLLMLGHANVEINRKSVIVMWSVFCFGLSGIIMQLMNIEDSLVIGVICAGIVNMILYRHIPILSYYLKYNNQKTGFSYFSVVRTKYNGYVGSFLILVLTVIIVILCINFKDEQQLTQQFNKETFVPVKLIGQETYHGTTLYILEAKGQKFYVSPFEHPEVRNITPNSKVKIIFGDFNISYHLKEAKKIQFKN